MNLPSLPIKRMIEGGNHAQFVAPVGGSAHAARRRGPACRRAALSGPIPASALSAALPLAGTAARAGALSGFGAVSRAARGAAAPHANRDRSQSRPDLRGPSRARRRTLRNRAAPDSDRDARDADLPPAHAHGFRPHPGPDLRRPARPGAVRRRRPLDRDAGTGAAADPAAGDRQRARCRPDLRGSARSRIVRGGSPLSHAGDCIDADESVQSPPGPGGGRERDRRAELQRAVRHDAVPDGRAGRPRSAGHDANPRRRHVRPSRRTEHAAGAGSCLRAARRPRRRRLCRLRGPAGHPAAERAGGAGLRGIQQRCDGFRQMRGAAAGHPRFRGSEDPRRLRLPDQGRRAAVRRLRRRPVRGGGARSERTGGARLRGIVGRQ